MPEAEDCVNESVAIPSRLADVIDQISDYEAGELLKSILHTFAIGNYCEPGNGTARVIFALLQEDLRRLNPRTEE